MDGLIGLIVLILFILSNVAVMALIGRKNSDSWKGWWNS